MNIDGLAECIFVDRVSRGDGLVAGYYDYLPVAEQAFAAAEAFEDYRLRHRGHAPSMPLSPLRDK